MKEKQEFPYADIVDLPHYEPKRHRRMTRYARAAQFAPFMALAGYEKALEETARYTEPKIELDNDEKLRISETLMQISEVLPTTREVKIKYFKPDSVKRGGAYLWYTGVPKRVDPYMQRLIFADDFSVDFTNLYVVELKD